MAEKYGNDGLSPTVSPTLDTFQKTAEELEQKVDTMQELASLRGSEERMRGLQLGMRIIRTMLDRNKPQPPNNN